jgi:hypothetical protein
MNFKRFFNINKEIILFLFVGFLFSIAVAVELVHEEILDGLILGGIVALLVGRSLEIEEKYDLNNQYEKLEEKILYKTVEEELKKPGLKKQLEYVEAGGEYKDLTKEDLEVFIEKTK